MSVVNRAQVDTMKRMQSYFTQRAKSMAMRGLADGAAKYERWRQTLADVSASRARGCKGCYYEGEEVNRCMTCDQMLWRTNKHTKKEEA